MRLSEAMMLSSTLGETPTNDSWNNCLLGIACHALGKTNFENDEARRRWPWLDKYCSHPKVAGGLRRPGAALVTLISTWVTSGHISVERAAELVAKLEPQDIPREQTEIGQGHRIAQLEATKRR
jgi:hypothetical protein